MAFRVFLAQLYLFCGDQERQGVCPWPSVMRFRFREQWQSLLRVGTLRFPGGRVLLLVKTERDDEEEGSVFS